MRGTGRHARHGRLLALGLTLWLAGASACGSDTVVRGQIDVGGDTAEGVDIAWPDGEAPPPPDVHADLAPDVPEAPPDAGADAVTVLEDVTADSGGVLPDVADDDGMAPDAAEDVDGPPDASGPDAQGEDVVTIPPFLDVTIEASVDVEGWALVERCRVDHDALTPEPFIAKTRHTDEGILAGFGGVADPPPERFLLHAAHGYDTATGTPVLLVHGVGSQATQTYLDPDPLGLDLGLATTLAEAGRPVFAVTFPARYGDSYNQAIELAAALQVVRQHTGAAKVDVVAHSKGGLVVLAYVTGLLEARGLPYQGDVHRLVLLATPLGGMDFSFRHPAFNYSSSVWGLELPTSWDQSLLWGVWQDTLEESIYGGAYAGLLQSLARWDEQYPLTMLEQDWYTTYEGGQGFVSHSLGIDAAIEMGGDFVSLLRERALPEGISYAVLAGNSPSVGGIPWETSGPADALVFVASATDTEWLTRDGATELEVAELSLNHWELVHDEEATAWVRTVLDR